MKTVLLLGAGASVAEAIAHDIPFVELPPLDCSFLSYIQSHDGGNFRLLSQYCEKWLGINLFEQKPSMEFLFNRIYFLSTEGGTKEVIHRKMLEGLVRLLTRSTAGSTNIVQTTKAGPLNKLIRRLTKTSQLGELSIITFNYDILVERILNSLNQHNVSLNSSYCLKNVNIMSNISARAAQFSSEHGGTSIKILKLHGSLNWFRAWNYKIHQPSSSEIDSDEVFLYSGLGTLEEWNLLELELEDKREAQMLPVVVPPIYDKEQYYNVVLGPIWQEAEKALGEAVKLIIFGYSLPDADIKAQLLLSKSLFESNQKKELNIINSDASICNHFSNRLPIENFRYYKNVKSFLSENPK